jgi:endonuclease/exonuclease/phosphatase family metal-dependent hydrolase
MIACHGALRHRYSVLPPELQDDPSNPAHIPCSGLDWAALVLRTKQAHIAVISLYLRPGESDDHLITLQQIRRFIQHANLPFILAGDFNMTPEKMANSGLLNGLKGAFLTPMGATATCHTRTTATLIDYCFIDHRIIAL